MEMLDPVELYVEIDDFSRKVYSELNQRGRIFNQIETFKQALKYKG
jgi:hypothetical protein